MKNFSKINFLNIDILLLVTTICIQRSIMIVIIQQFNNRSYIDRLICGQFKFVITLSPFDISKSFSLIVKCVADSNSVNRLMCGQLKFDRTLLNNFIYPFSKTFSTNVLAFTSCNDVIIIIQSL
ncbi:hypothetical protein BLOT_011460 [Blomia tropicalis]|nr:hypothetical protein BLOT_011460 [Blomia tropicalis]